jgi:phenolic acid decarboxylase
MRQIEAEKPVEARGCVRGQNVGASGPAHEQNHGRVDFCGTDVSGLAGRHLIYRYEGGWQYELYVKNASTIDYRIHSGLVAGRWVKDQLVELVHLGDRRYKLSWTEPTGTSVSLAIDLSERRLHGVIFFPQWVHENPQKTVCFQNAFLEEMRRHRDAGPTYPIVVIDKFAHIHFVEDAGIDNEQVICVPPSQLPAGYLDRAN